MIRLALLLVLLSPAVVWAQPTFSVVCSVGWNDNNTSFATDTGTDAGTCGSSGTFTLAASKVALAVWQGSDGGGITASPPSLTSSHGTWRHVASFIDAGFTRTHSWCLETGAGASAVATIDFTGVGDAQSNGVFSVVEITGMETAGDCEDNLLQKSEYQSTDTDTSTATFAAFSDTDNRPFLAVTKALSTNATCEWTEAWDTNTATESRTGYGCYDTASDDTEVVVTWGSATSATAHGILFEVVAAAATSADIQMGTGMWSGGFGD